MKRVRITMVWIADKVDERISMDGLQGRFEQMAGNMARFDIVDTFDALQPDDGPMVEAATVETKVEEA